MLSFCILCRNRSMYMESNLSKRRWFCLLNVNARKSVSATSCLTVNFNTLYESKRESHLSMHLSERDDAIVNLSHDVFSRGSVLLKNVDMLSALPEGFHSFPEVCFIGKPNVGKSAIIGSLLHNPILGRSQHKRGSTRLLKFFNVGDALLLVDTPGYGQWSERGIKFRFATQANAFAILFRYLSLRKSANLKRVYWVMSASATKPMTFQPRDEELRGFLMNECIPFSVILNKIDRHYRYAVNINKTKTITDREGIPSFSWNPSLRVAPPMPASHCTSEHTYSPRSRTAQKVCKTYNPEKGIAHNMMEIYNFLGSSEVPVLAVCTNAHVPHLNLNMEALQHDIIYYCTKELTELTDLTYKNLHNLSYAPPRINEIDEVQRRYPIESFILPEDDNTTLEEMVEHYESLCKRVLPDALTPHANTDAILEESTTPDNINKSNNNSTNINISHEDDNYLYITKHNTLESEFNTLTLATPNREVKLPLEYKTNLTRLTTSDDESLAMSNVKMNVICNKVINNTIFQERNPHERTRFRPSPLRQIDDYDVESTFDEIDVNDDENKYDCTSQDNIVEHNNAQISELPQQTSDSNTNDIILSQEKCTVDCDDCSSNNNSNINNNNNNVIYKSNHDVIEKETTTSTSNWVARKDAQDLSLSTGDKEQLQQPLAVQVNSSTLTTNNITEKEHTKIAFSEVPVSNQPLPLPFALDTSSSYVRAIDGTPIPRSMLLQSIKDKVLSKQDELPYFASKSGARAYERLLQENNSDAALAAYDVNAYNNMINNLSKPCGPNSTDVFLQNTPEALLPEHILDQFSKLEHTSRLKQRKKHLIDKYLKKIRKERSIHMQAEGYMCPWLASAGQQNRLAVHGLETTSNKPLPIRFGQGGAPLHRLKSVGFGGMSLTTCTLKNRGRATKKTFWWSSERHSFT